jgi:hypothetical protein
LGVLLGVAWWVLSPRPSARYVGLFWYSEVDPAFSAAQDVFFALVTAGPGLLVGVLLTMWCSRPRAGRRLTVWLSGTVAGSLACWLTGCLLGHGFSAYQLGTITAAPLTLTSYGLLALWPAAAAFLATVALTAKGLFSSSW